MSYGASFKGFISEIPNISVDNFTNKDVAAYFLSHTHTDHTVGLYDQRFIQTLEMNNANIYMSEMSAAIVKYELKNRWKNFDGLEKILEKIMPVGLETISVVLPADPTRRLEETHLLVTVIPAGHSFGSVMFLLQTNSKTILYTGDFRMSSNDVSKHRQLHDNGSPITIDALYIDTTFIDPRYTNFPKRSTSVEVAIHEIDSWLKRDENNRVAVKTSAKFGYEYVFNELYKKLGVKVYVEDVRWKELYSNLGHLTPGVTNSASPIHLCWPKYRTDHSNCTPFESTKLKYLNIHLSAQKWRNFEVDDNPIDKISDHEIDVCFSTHCSRSELMYFKNYFMPKKVVGFPNIICDSPVKRFDDEYNLSPKKRKVDRKIPQGIENLFDTTRRNEINKPMMPEGYGHRGKDPYHPAWMDYCDPYHCNDYHKLACGLNRRTLRFKWFQSGCHIILNNKCASFRGSLKYDMVDVKFCYIYVMYLRLGCQECERGGDMVCGVSLVDNHVALFRDSCALERANCEPGSFHEYEEVRIGLCAYYLNLDTKKLE
ncbi:hypothetical protein MSG28_015915 [Choristoneura fumiferana]|uniref:Uncharacterized protein n=1 Tax=Choristoneura fumiferana TaxID=7141 RepID=A0ACC0K4K3_CHOFU|nr:hypothetical protein MSG28_015915 [Choristoneura fumiferana]